jgi:putative inorganic carbon (HCO3(-)) transporter
MTAELLAQLGGPVAAAGLALLLLAPARQARLAGLVVWGLGMALFVPLLAPSGQRGELVGAGVLALAGVAGLSFVFRRWPWALAFLTLAALPARIPVTVGDESANLLIPLYAVVVGAAVALGWSLWRGDERRRELGMLSWPLALFVAWVSLSVLWTNDPREGAVALFFFVLPFTLLALALARLPWSDVSLAWLFRLLLAMALVFAGVGVWQWLTRDIFWNPKVIASNVYAPFYRVNSVFWDPSIYGRFLVVAILVALTLLLFGRWRRWDWPLAIAIASCWAGLLFSFSQSSFAALVAGVVLAAVLAWRWRAVAAVALVAAVMIPVGFAAPQFENVRDSLTASSTRELNRATRGRTKLVSNGLRIAADHPLAGVGVGGFEGAYRERVEVSARVDEPASHTTPVTVAAETGVVGLALFAWLVGTALVVALRRTRAAPPSVRVAGLAVGLGLFAVFVHSLFYSAFLEDPMTWGFLGLTALAARESTREAGATVPVAAPASSPEQPEAPRASTGKKRRLPSPQPAERRLLE